MDIPELWETYVLKRSCFLKSLAVWGVVAAVAADWIWAWSPAGDSVLAADWKFQPKITKNEISDA